MKKLMFAAAIAASAAAFADPINSIGFAGYDLGATFTNGQAEKDESGNDKAATYGYFCFYGESDSSVVTNVNHSTTNHTAAFADAEDAKYLALDTEGGTLWRSINTLTRYPIDENNAVYSNGTARAVAADGTYLDTLVQFTVTEDEAPTVGEEDKLAIWLQAGEGTTNLMVRAGFVDDDGTSTTQSPMTYTLTTQSPVQPGNWYRLTVKAIADVTKCVAKNPEAYQAGYTGFEIYLDGELLAATTSTFGQGYIDLAIDAGEYGWLDQTEDATFITYLQSGKAFPALGLPTTAATLQGVGFQGTGAVDEIVWTDDNPFPAAVVEFTLTYSGDANTTLGAVSYTVDGGEAQAVTSGDKIPEGASVSIAQPTFANGYQLASITTNSETVTVASWPYVFTMGADTTVAITSAQITYTLTLPVVANATAAVTAGGTPVSDLTAIPAGTAIVVTWTVTDPDYEITAGVTQNITMNSAVTADTPTVVKKANWVDDVSTITAGTKASEQYASLAGTAVANADAAQLTTWAKGVGNVSFADAGKDEINVEAFLLNIANDSTTAQIDAAKEAFVLNITVAADGTPTVTLPSGKTYNGKVQMKGSNDLSTWTDVNAASKTYHFYKYELSLPAAE